MRLARCLWMIGALASRLQASPDGRNLAVMAATYSQNVWMMENL
jgi:hypothetical protein